MKSQYDYFEFREVTKDDEFHYNTLGFYAPVKIRIKNDWKFGFACDCANISLPLVDLKHLSDLVTLSKKVDCINFTVKNKRAKLLYA